jgi:hypothetical protein
MPSSRGRGERTRGEPGSSAASASETPRAAR